MSLAVLIAASVLPLTVESMPASSCRFGNSTYDTGDTWYLRVSDKGNEFCAMCKCLPGSRLDCKPVGCGQACSGNSEEDRACCNICREADLNGPPFGRNTGSQVRNGRTSPALCMHNGDIYSQGQKFTSNNTSLTPIRASQCVQCVCEDSAVRCKLEECPAVHCPSPITKPGYCCSTCPDSYSRFLNDRLHPAAEAAADGAVMSLAGLGGASVFTVESPSPRVHVDCVSGGKVYPNGATWHPLMGPFGRLACQICRCRAGRVECSRVQCPKPTCMRPHLVAGQCCPLCESNSKVSDRAIGSPVSPPVKCVPVQRSIIVWRSHAGANVSQYIQYIFEHPGRYDRDSEKHQWTFRNGTIHSFRVDKFTDRNVVDLKRHSHWEMLGTTTSRRLMKFQRREERVRQRCSAGCSRRVLRVERTLRLQPAKQRPVCRGGERQL